MKYFDEVKVIKMRKSYEEDDIKLGDIGTIWFPEIRDGEFYVCFETGDTWNAYKYSSIKIEDLELLKEAKESEAVLFDELPKNNPKWWCKVENGYIMNLLGEKKNKIPYDYNS